MSARFRNYPEPREGPSVPYKHEELSLPVLRGSTLAIGATLIHSLDFVQNILWRGAGLNVARHIKDLDRYTPRFDPTVTPIQDDASKPVELPVPTKCRDGDNLGFYTSADYHARYLSGELTPLEVVEALLPLIRRDTNPPGKHSVAFLESQVDAIRAAAEASTQRYKSGKPLGPLDGVPVAVKDEVHLKGYGRWLGSKIDFKRGIEDTSWCVKKWEEAGAIVVGKTTMHEIGIDTTNNNSNYGTPRNPYNPDYYCGGSSGGSGYAIAAGLVPIALGADGGGSIRIPASFCGIWGLKPSHGRISAAPTPGLAQSVGVYGPMAASIDDLALAYRVMASPAPAQDDALSSGFPDPLTTIPSPSAESRRAKTIGLVRPWIDRAEPVVRAFFDAAVEFYSNQKGYTVVDIEIPYLPEGQRAHALTILSEIATSIDPADVRRLLPHSKLLISVSGSKATSQDYVAAQKLRQLLMSHLAHLFTRHPGLIILTPTTPIPGWKIAGGEKDLTHGVSDGKASTRNMEYVWLANFTGCPAISCPVGYVRDTNMPVGIMGMSEWGSEEALIAFARDGEGILDLEIAASKSTATGSTAPAAAAGEDSVVVGKGLRTPREASSSSNWVDIIAEAGKKKEEISKK
ncbi:hypothetical protein VTN77DRAFT_7946 [Rasamsonia byssochlamydoides]|uniref:uncharacterized protein n=1 Tax=Rasamsonia byssochlamydoides TaxID=89139 RepID=UPI003742A1D1